MLKRKKKGQIKTQRGFLGKQTKKNRAMEND